MRDRQTASNELHTASPSNIRPLSFIFIPHASIFMNFAQIFGAAVGKNVNLTATNDVTVTHIQHC